MNVWTDHRIQLKINRIGIQESTRVPSNKTEIWKWLEFSRPLFRGLLFIKGKEKIFNRSTRRNIIPTAEWGPWWFNEKCFDKSDPFLSNLFSDDSRSVPIRNWTFLHQLFITTGSISNSGPNDRIFSNTLDFSSSWFILKFFVHSLLTVQNFLSGDWHSRDLKQIHSWIQNLALQGQ